MLSEISPTLSTVTVRRCRNWRRSPSKPVNGAQRISLADIEGAERKPFDYFDKGIMAMIGRKAAVAEIGPHRREIEGPIAFVAWIGVHAALLSTTRAKIEAFVEWAWDYFSEQRATRCSTASVRRA